MGKKIFVSYKYKDKDVQALPGVKPYTWVRDYVDYIADHLIENGDVYKGEDNTEDLSDMSETYIWNHLKDKIYDSSVTIVLISPNMRETGKWQRSQWIPWEIAYSLRETTRTDFTSHSNAILAVILPDSKGRYSYYNKDNLFPILKSNIDNDYIYVVRWDDFLKYTDADINIAISHKEKTPTYKIVKTL
jgi:triacylglycerol esterase/lipase EstA (alpha/beta hydrolase family)